MAMTSELQMYENLCVIAWLNHVGEKESATIRHYMI
jgi:hypothetical protein